MVEGKPVEIVQADAARLPFADDVFTCAAMMQVFFFFLEPAAVLAECRRVLTPGGRLAVFTVSEEARGSPAAPEPMASRARFYSGDDLAESFEAREGDFVWVPPNLVHVEQNISGRDPVRMVVARSTQETLVFNLPTPVGWSPIR